MRNKRFAQNLVRCFLQNRFQASAYLIYKIELVHVISLELAENRQFCSNSWADELSVCVKRMWPVFLNVRRPGVLANWLMYWLTRRKTPSYLLLLYNSVKEVGLVGWGLCGDDASGGCWGWGEGVSIIWLSVFRCPINLFDFELSRH